jgi:nucleoside phosphorylase
VKIPRSLLDACGEGRLIPFAGSGVSSWVRIREGRRFSPFLPDLLKAAADRLDEELKLEEATAVRHLINVDQSLAFQKACASLGPLYKRFLTEHLSPQREIVREDSLALPQMLWRLNNGFVVTDVQDDALAWACPSGVELTLVGARDALSILEHWPSDAKQAHLWYVFGSMRQGDAIFTNDGRHSLIPEPSHASRLAEASTSLRRLFAGPQSVLFIGSSAPVRLAREFFAEAKDTVHYYFVHQSSYNDLQLQLRQRDLGMIQPIQFPDYQSFLPFLDELAKEGRGPSKALPAKAVSDSVPNKSVRDLAGSEIRIVAPREREERTQTCDVVIVCALHSPELEKILSTCQAKWAEMPSKPDDPHTYHQNNLTTQRGARLCVVAAAPNQMGLAASAVLATKMILRFRPKLVAMVGIAAGAKSDSQGYGDILAAEHTFDYGAGKVSREGGRLVLRPDPKPIDIHARLKQRLKHWQSQRLCLDEISKAWPAEKPQTILQLHVGPLGSGAAVIDDREPVESVSAHWRKLIGVEMEAYAVHYACREAVEPSPAFLCLKSICDFAQEKDDRWQQYAAYTAAQFCFRFLTVEWENLYF